MNGARAIATVLIACVINAVAGDAMSVEKLAYRAIERDGCFELRRIAPHVVAETVVDGDFESVGSEGFRRLVAYIGGDNRTRAEISMTAPVVQSPTSEKISMTAPVAQQKVGGAYRIEFVMPSDYTIETLPEPTDERVRLRVEPERTVAAVRYSGFWSRSRYDEQERMLREWIDARGLEPIGEAVWARYDPPFMPWFLRRNEILIPVRSRAQSAAPTSVR